MFTPIGQILPETVKKAGIAAQAAKAKTMASFESAVKSVLSSDIQSEAKPLHCSDGTLTIACTTSRTALALRRHEHRLLQSLKETGAERLRFLLCPWR